MFLSDPFLCCKTKGGDDAHFRSQVTGRSTSSTTVAFCLPSHCLQGFLLKSKSMASIVSLYRYRSIYHWLSNLTEKAFSPDSSWCPVLLPRMLFSDVILRLGYLLDSPGNFCLNNTNPCFLQISISKGLSF